MQIHQMIIPFLSFKSGAEEAAGFYVSIFPDSKIVKTINNPATGTVMTVEFELAGMRFVALNVGQPWEFSHAFSLSVACETQGEIDRLWSSLSDGGKEVQCGWLVDKFGLSWQIVPVNIGELMSNPDPAKAGRVMQALLQMTKLNIAELEKAAASE
jgi:predicted 3-demethylubiquinone-9 3-methyltransferase (glyoxalase superfamily)